ncbi:hypothetical protein PG988_011558 [Apiospora saccharicola]
MEELPMEPRGLFFQPDFVTPAHEAELVRVFREELDWPARPPGTRLSLHYGYTFDYKTFGVDPAIPFREFPEWLRPPDPQDGPGRDPARPGLFAVLPAGGGHSAARRYALGFRRPAEEGEGKEDERAELDLAPRSLLEMRGDARLHWTHGIKKRKTDTLPDGTVRLRQDRWSITYRWLRERADKDTPAECECGDARQCDTAQRRVGIEREYRWKQQEQEKKPEAAPQQVTTS